MIVLAAILCTISLYLGTITYLESDAIDGHWNAIKNSISTAILWPYVLVMELIAYLKNRIHKG